jgi:TonB family protein
MVHSPIPVAHEVSWPGVFPAPRSPQPTSALAQPETASVLTTLRLQIEAGASEFTAIIGGIAAAAQSLTDARGAAIAIGHDRDVVCVGRSGDTAPSLGARVSVDSGFSGVCLRSRKTLRCDDTQMDQRVDAEVCLGLGLRSIVAVPLQGDFGMVGVLEAFSVFPFAFSDAHIELLEQLAQLVELAHVQIARQEAAARRELALFEPEVAELASELSLEHNSVEDVREFLATREKPPRRVAISIAIASAVLLSILGWSEWHKPAKAAQPTEEAAAVEAQPAADSSQVLTLNFAPKPAPSQPLHGVAARHHVRQAADAEDDTDDVVVHNFTDTPSTPSQPAGDSSAPAHQAVVTATEAPVSEPPKTAGLGIAHATPQELIPAPAPTLAPVVSLGVSRGALQHRVTPEYPALAQSLHLTGTVVLQATIDETGAVQEVSVVSGQPTLARAAMEAVKQWRYAPSLLNGKPVKVKTNVTVNFAP